MNALFASGLFHSPRLPVSTVREATSSFPRSLGGCGRSFGRADFRPGCGIG